MKFVQFFQSGLFSGGLIEATGDRSVIIYDDRESHHKHVEDAKEECEKRGFAAFQFCRGQSFTRNNKISPILMK